jgi:hypothetical protein
VRLGDALDERLTFLSLRSKNRGGCVGPLGPAALPLAGDVYTPYGRFDMSRLLTLQRRVVVLRTTYQKALLFWGLDSSSAVQVPPPPVHPRPGFLGVQRASPPLRYPASCYGSFPPAVLGKGATLSHTSHLRLVPRVFPLGERGWVLTDNLAGSPVNFFPTRRGRLPAGRKKS